MSEYADFDLDRSISQAWSQFRDRLAEVVSVIDDEGELRIGTLSSTADPAPYVLFREHARGGTDMIVAQASSNASLGEAFQLRLDQLNQLERLGWNPPEAEGEHRSRDFWVQDEQEHAERISDLAVTTLRDVFGVQHPVFLAPDQLAEVLQPEAPAEDLGPRSDAAPLFDADELVATMPRGRDHLDELVTRELADLFGHAPIRDSEGDVAIRVGSSMVFVRSTPDARELVLFSALVHEVEGRSRATEVLNDLNVESRYGRFALHRDRVYVSMSLLAQPFVPAHLHQALRVMSQLADGIDNELAERLRGRVTFTDGD